MIKTLGGDILPVLVKVAAGAVAKEERREAVTGGRTRAGRIRSLGERRGEPERPGGAGFPYVDAQQAAFISRFERVLKSVVVESTLAVIVATKGGLAADVEAGEHVAVHGAVERFGQPQAGGHESEALIVIEETVTGVGQAQVQHRGRP